MPPTETPPKPTTAAPPPPPVSDGGSSAYSQPETAPIRISTRRHGEIDHTELVHLLDSLEGDQAKSRFRESIYISVIFYLALAWLIVYGPKYVFHQGTVVPSKAEQQEKQRLTEMALNQDLTKLNQPKPAPKPPPKIDRKLLDQLQQMQRASEAAKAAREKAPEAPPQPPAPQPAAQPPPPTVARTETPPLPAAPTPQPKASIPDSPQPNNLPAAPSAAAPSARSSVEDAARAASSSRAGGRLSGGGAHVGQQTAGSGVEILSDTRGVDFSEWLKKLKREIMASWIPLIPEEVQPPLNKEGWTMIRITVEPNGTVTAMHLDDSSKDRAIDKAAWGSITGVGQLPPLPKEFTGPNLELRMQFVITHNPAEVD
jgi:TonB family protein